MIYKNTKKYGFQQGWLYALVPPSRAPSTGRYLDHVIMQELVFKFIVLVVGAEKISYLSWEVTTP